MHVIERTKHGRWPRPTLTNDQRLQQFRAKLAQLSTVVPNEFFHRRLFAGTHPKKEQQA